MNIEELRDKVDRVRSEAETNHVDDESLSESEFDIVNQKLDTFEEVLELLESILDELDIVHDLS